MSQNGTALIVHPNTHTPHIIEVLVPEISNPGHEYIFESGINTATKIVGWKPVGMIGYDPVNPLTTVHDCFEHFPKTTVGGAMDEMLAQGAMMRTRLKGGFWGEFHTASFDLDAFLHTQVPGAWGMLFATLLTRGMDLKECPVIEGVPQKLPSRMEQVLMRILAFADSLIGQRDIWGSFNSKLNRLDLSQVTHCREAVAIAAPWMRLGYFLAGVRYQDLDERRLVRLFQRTVTKVEDILHTEEHLRKDRRGGETSVMKLRIDPSKYETDVTLCMRTIAAELSVAERDQLDLVQDDELIRVLEA